MSSELPLDIEVREDAVVARPRGEIDMASAEPLRARLASVAHDEDTECLVVDLAAVSYLDSSAVEMLFQLHGQLERHGIDLVVVAPPASRAERLLSLVRLDEVGEVCRSVDDALAACARETAQ
jgi:anti-anti-sigma factor